MLIGIYALLLDTHIVMNVTNINWTKICLNSNYIRATYFHTKNQFFSDPPPTPPPQTHTPLAELGAFRAKLERILGSS